MPYHLRFLGGDYLDSLYHRGFTCFRSRLPYLVQATHDSSVTISYRHKLEVGNSFYFGDYSFKFRGDHVFLLRRADVHRSRQHSASYDGRFTLPIRHLYRRPNVQVIRRGATPLASGRRRSVGANHVSVLGRGVQLHGPTVRPRADSNLITYSPRLVPTFHGLFLNRRWFFVAGIFEYGRGCCFYRAIIPRS